MQDLISRQAAIEALDKLHYNDIEDWCFVLDTIEYLPSAHPEQRWIPVNEKLPEETGRYLITGKMGAVYSVEYEGGRWYGGIKPIAWMPLPKPYNEDET